MGARAHSSILLWLMPDTSTHQGTSPTPKLILVNNIFQFIRFLAQVPADALVYFRGAAEELIEEQGAVDAVAAALAHISGTTEIKTRSLLSSQEVQYHHIPFA